MAGSTPRTVEPCAPQLCCNPNSSPTVQQAGSLCTSVSLPGAWCMECCGSHWGTCVAAFPDQNLSTPCSMPQTPQTVAGREPCQAKDQSVLATCLGWAHATTLCVGWEHTKNMRGCCKFEAPLPVACCVDCCGPPRSAFQRALSKHDLATPHSMPQAASTQAAGEPSTAPCTHSLLLLVAATDNILKHTSFRTIQAVGQQPGTWLGAPGGRGCPG